MTPMQCRMARAALRWSISDLAKAAGKRSATVSNFERGLRFYPSTAKAMRLALEGAGVSFISDGEASASGGEGLRLRQAAA